jgi:hypothetical protein
MKENTYKIWSINLNIRHRLEKLGVDGRQILRKVSQEIGFADVDWINLPQDEGQWRAVVKTVINIRVP